MNRFILALSITAALVGCKSVPLDNVPVEDRSGSTTQNGGANTNGVGSQVGQNNVPSVDLTKNAGDAAGPTGVARVIYFGYDSYAIKPEYQGAIDGHARFMKSGQGKKLVVEGHTDDRGGREYNLALGQKRAEAVRRSLVLLGVSDNSIEAVSFGKEKLAVQGASEDAHTQNRRAEMSYR